MTKTQADWEDFFYDVYKSEGMRSRGIESMFLEAGYYAAKLDRTTGYAIESLSFDASKNVRGVIRELEDMADNMPHPHVEEILNALIEVANRV